VLRNNSSLDRQVLASSGHPETGDRQPSTFAVSGENPGPTRTVEAHHGHVAQRSQARDLVEM
jgi:hypothetical protein